jgi:transcriptional regulator of acetoin/glycerol metabolism
MDTKFIYKGLPRPESSNLISGIQTAWVKYIEEGIKPESLLRSEIIASWERSKKFGVNPLQKQVEESIGNDELSLFQEKNDKLLHYARPDMKFLAESLEGSGTIITISDKNGLLLDMYGDREILRRAEKINFLPGSVWSEEVAGTNAIGTVIKNKMPVQILFTEHFCTGWQDWICAAAPILNPFSHELMGVLDISGKWRNIHPHTLGLAISKANNITRYIERIIYHEGLRMNPFLTATLGSFEDGIIIADEKKNILRTNTKVESFINEINKKKSLKDYPEIEELVDNVISSKLSVVENELTLNGMRDRFICTVHPVMFDRNTLLGIVVCLRKSAQKLNAKESKSIISAADSGITRYTFDHMIGSAPTFVKSVDKARKAASLDSTLLLTGESGTGKELFAQAIHNASERSHNPFIALNCGAIPRELIESELFGYEQGAFTGAKQKGSKGKFELADGGTIFLDEIGDMPLEVQVHLLRVLEERMIMRVGGDKVIPINVRVIAATHKNLMDAVRTGTFRADLYYRLRVIELKIPSVRDRSSDIPLLVKHFLKQLSGKFGKKDIQVDLQAMRCLQSYSWPGNIRELKNVIEQAIFNMEGNTILPCDLPSELLAGEEQSVTCEKEHFITVIKAAGGNITLAAERLGISRATMYRKMKQLGISSETVH